MPPHLAKTKKKKKKAVKFLGSFFLIFFFLFYFCVIFFFQALHTLGKGTAVATDNLFLFILEVLEEEHAFLIVLGEMVPALVNKKQDSNLICIS